MSVAPLLAELRSRDIHVWPDGDQLRCNAPAGVLTPDLQNQLRQQKGQIVQFLRSAEALARQEPAIVPLQPHGERVPVFAVAGHNGDVFCYRALLQHLGNDQPFFGLQPPGLDGDSKPVASVEDLATYFAGQIRAFRPGGPCVIAGYCAGGTIAFELARQLLRHGVTISFVALFAGSYPTWFRVLPQLRRRCAHRMARMSVHARILASLPHRERRLYITELLRRRMADGDESRGARPDPVSILRVKVEHATMCGVRRYTPRYFDGSLRLFLPNHEWLRSRHEPLRWKMSARDTEEYCGPEGCEGDRMLLEPHVRVLADFFRRCRER